MIYTGRRIGADEAKSIGLVNEIYRSREEMLEAAKESLRIVTTRSPNAIALCKEIMTSLDGKSTRQCLDVENEGFRQAFTSREMREGTAAFLSKRTPLFAGPRE